MQGESLPPGGGMVAGYDALGVQRPAPNNNGAANAAPASSNPRARENS